MGVVRCEDILQLQENGNFGPQDGDVVKYKVDKEELSQSAMLGHLANTYKGDVVEVGFSHIPLMSACAKRYTRIYESREAH